MQLRASSNGNLHQNLDENSFFFFNKNQTTFKHLVRGWQILRMLFFSPIGWQILARRQKCQGQQEYQSIPIFGGTLSRKEAVWSCVAYFFRWYKSMPRWSTGYNPPTRFKARDDIARNTVNGGGSPRFTPCELGDVEASKTWATEELYSRNRQMISNDFNLRSKISLYYLQDYWYPRFLSIHRKFRQPVRSVYLER